ncbi:MAG: M28 family peptidase [Gracilimonas sp.]|nr:M28 family peptidase [Gracilimonas sp.]
MNGSKSAQNADIYSFADEITIDGLYSDLAVLAHDSLQGRETGTIGEQKAANYLSKRYKEMGLKPVGDDNTYFQHYELVQPAIGEISYKLTKSESGEVVERSVHNQNEYGNFVTIFGGNDPLEGSVVFVGAGINDEETGVNHFSTDLSGKWVLVFYEEGQTNMRYLQSALSSEGALGTIIIVGTDVEDFEQEAESRMTEFGQGRGLSLRYLQENNMGNAPAFNRVHPQLAAEMLGLKSLDALEEMQQRIFSQPESFEAYDLNYELEHHPVIKENIVETQNVVAFLEGSDPAMKHEVVVLSSHYDHVGIGSPDSTGDNIYNGADDDGSGTTASLQTAQAMMKAKNAGVGPKRSVLFLNVSGEEKGLLGSRYYSDHPIYSIQNTVANINMDMIGRVDPEHVEDSSYVYIIGGEIISSGLDSLARVANEMGPNMTLSERYNDLEDPNQFYRRSDHWNFGRLGVPFVFFFNGTHEDYHRPQDHVEKITFEPFLQRTHLVYNLTALLANSPERPIVDNQEFIEKTQVQPR